MPAKAEKLLKKYLRLKEKAGSLFGESAAALQEAMSLTKSCRRTGAAERVIEPGAVYAFAVPVMVAGKLKSTIQVMDNFAQPEVMKICRVSRWEAKLWKGDGPAAERPERAAVNAEREEDQLP